MLKSWDQFHQFERHSWRDDTMEHSRHYYYGLFKYCFDVNASASLSLLLVLSILSISRERDDEVVLNFEVIRDPESRSEIQIGFCLRWELTAFRTLASQIYYTALPLSRLCFMLYILPSHDMTNSFELCHILVTNATVRRSSTSSLKECGISRERWSNNTVP